MLPVGFYVDGHVCEIFYSNPSGFDFILMLVLAQVQSRSRKYEQRATRDTVQPTGSRKCKVQGEVLWFVTQVKADLTT